MLQFLLRLNFRCWLDAVEVQTDDRWNLEWAVMRFSVKCKTARYNVDIMLRILDGLMRISCLNF